MWSASGVDWPCACYGLGAGGPVGAARVFAIFRQELEDGLRLLGKGTGSIEDIGPDIFYPCTH